MPVNHWSMVDFKLQNLLKMNYKLLHDRGDKAVKLIKSGIEIEIEINVHKSGGQEENTFYL